MDQDLLPYLLAAFPAAAARLQAPPEGDALIIRGYRIAADALDGQLLALLEGPRPDAGARAA